MSGLSRYSMKTHGRPWKLLGEGIREGRRELNSFYDYKVMDFGLMDCCVVVVDGGGWWGFLLPVSHGVGINCRTHKVSIAN